MNFRFAPLVLVLAVAAGCALQKKEPPPKPFVGTRWDVMLEVPMPGEQPHFRFGDGRVEGFAGCNRVSAQYIQDSIGVKAIALRRIETGTKACDPMARAVESRVLAVLQSVSSYSIEGDVMKMSGSAGTIVLRAHPQEVKQ